ncbi:SRPBCC domain-containing protein [Allokutzneria sp. A3M-2-11 16]|uniref:SRPBCC family protein n=1 Tax=Allokutzneria sp. A3M-2-11 16 TaxID=2962043 RepID=UPI0020B8CF81|nr:SRPBCC domain-containing protein [Allokutzneria sp. A3M-2-11 16]MCP3805257.1 SRPBCC domain-containing protein [Allokutzneria sp. A3M-2-11 16]
MGREFELRLEVVLPATPEEVWTLVATPEGQAAWFMPGEEIGPDGAEVWDPPKRLVFRTPSADDGSFHAFEYLIEGQEDGTALTFVHSGVTGAGWSEEYEEITTIGWAFYLHTMREYLTHFRGRPNVYVEADGPESSARQQAWDQLLATLGASAVGDEVSLDVPGLPRQQGVVDIINDNFVGFRTEDSLVRFHGRMRLGMSIAVSQHAYSPIDAEAYTAAWKAWLDAQFEGS